MRSNKIASILLIVLSCFFSQTGLAQKGKVLRINIGGEVFKEFKTGEFDSVEIQDSEVVKGEINGYEYVDLGLPSGLKWATCNVGAISPDEPGYYFQWGEITPKDEPTSENCTTFDVDLGEDISGNPDYDAARANWGSTWRMPTKDECKELMDKCNWEDSTFNGFAGKKVTGPNGNYIFLPYSGSKYGSKPNTYLGISGKIWTSIPLGIKNGRSIIFDSNGYKFTQSARYYPNPVRPVSD